MLILLPVAAFAATLLHLNGLLDRGQDSRRALLYAAILYGGAVTVIMEGLSLVQGIRQLPLALVWTCLLGLVLVLGVRRRTFATGYQWLVEDVKNTSRAQRILGVLVALIVLTLFAVAWISPVNNNDSFAYHMARVVHWAQNGSLRHYASLQAGQNPKPIWTETAILNLRVLYGDDTPANLVQWGCMAMSVIGVSAIAGLMGASGLAQAAASAFVVSIPLGVLTATNTKNDYAAAFWMVCLAYLVVLGKRRRLSALEVGLLGAATGLGMLTKGTFFPFAFAMLVWFFLPRLWTVGVVRTVGQGLLALSVAASLNLGFWARNLATYGDPYGGFARSVVTGEQAAPSAEAGEGAAIEEGEAPAPVGSAASGGAGFLAGVANQLCSRAVWLAIRVMRNIAQNVIVPEGAGTLRVGLYHFPGLFDSYFVASLKEAMWNHEDTAGNLLHLGLFFVSAAVILPGAFRRKEWLGVLYALMAFAGFVGLALIDYSVGLFGVRYQLPFFVLAAPVFAMALSWLERPSLAFTAGLLLVLAAVPYVLYNNTRPLVGDRPRTRTGSIFEVPAVDLVFTHVPDQQDDYLAAADLIRDSGCRDVGLAAPLGFMEYPLWWILDAPQSGIRIETLTPLPGLERYLDPAFEPCVVLCTMCAEAESWGDLVLLEEFGGLRLYREPAGVEG